MIFSCIHNYEIVFHNNVEIEFENVVCFSLSRLYLSRELYFPTIIINGPKRHFDISTKRIALKKFHWKTNETQGRSFVFRYHSGLLIISISLTLSKLPCFWFRSHYRNRKERRIFFIACLYPRIVSALFITFLCRKIYLLVYHFVKINSWEIFFRIHQNNCTSSSI